MTASATTRDTVPRTAIREGKHAAYRSLRATGVWGVGQLPAHWREKPLNRVAHINVDKLADNTDPDYEIEYIDIGNVTLEAGVQSTERLRFEDAPSRARRRVSAGDTIISTVRTYLKAVAHLAAPPDNLIVSTGFAVLHAGPELEPRFLYRLAQSEPFVQRIVAHSAGVSYPAINAADIGRFLIPLPPLDEQRAIADFLDRETAKIDELIDKKRRLVELLQEKRQALISRTVTRGLDPTAPMKPSGIDWLGSIPSHWKVIRIGFLVQFHGGATPRKENESYWNGEIPWVSPKDMKADVLNDSADHVTDSAIREAGLRLIPPPAVLIVVRGMILAHSFPVALTATAVTINQDMKALKPGRLFDAEFLTWLLRASAPTFFAIVEESGHGTRVLRTDVWSKQKVPVPPVTEQREIVDRINYVSARIDSLAAKARVAMDRLRELRSALISAAVTGQIDCRDLATEPREALARIEDSDGSPN